MGQRRVEGFGVVVVVSFIAVPRLAASRRRALLALAYGSRLNDSFIITFVPRYEYPEDRGRAESLEPSHHRAATGFAAVPRSPPSAPDNSGRSRCTSWPG